MPYRGAMVRSTGWCYLPSLLLGWTLTMLLLDMAVPRRAVAIDADSVAPPPGWIRGLGPMSLSPVDVTNPSSITTGYGQMVYVAEEDAVYVTSVSDQTLVRVPDAERATNWTLREVTVFAGLPATSPGPGQSETSRAAAGFNRPLGLVSVCPSSSSATARRLARCSPFALLVASEGDHVVVLVGLGEQRDYMRVVAGARGVSGPVTAEVAGPSSVLSSPGYMADLLNGGGFAVPLRPAGCIVELRPQNGSYHDGASFGTVDIKTLAGLCGTQASPSQNTLTFRQVSMNNPTSVAVSHDGVLIYFTETSTSTIVKITPMQPETARKTFILYVMKTGNGYFAWIHPLDAGTLLVTQGLSSDGILAVDITVGSQSPATFWVEDWATLPRWGRCLLALPSGRLLISRGNAQTSPWLWQHDGLAATWNPYNAKSPICNTRLNNRTLVGRPFDMLGEAEMNSTMNNEASSIQQMVFSEREQMVYAADNVNHIIRRFTISEGMDWLTLPQEIFAGQLHPAVNQPPPTLARDAVLWSPTGLVAVFPNGAFPRPTLFFDSPMLGMLISSREAHIVHYLDLGPSGTSGTRRTQPANKNESTVTLIAGQYFEAGTASGIGTNSRFHSPAFLFHILDGATYGLVDQDNHCIRWIRQPEVAGSFAAGGSDATTVSTFIGLCGQPGNNSALTTAGSLAWETPVLKGVTSAVVDLRLQTAYASQLDGIIWRVSPIDPPELRVLEPLAKLVNLRALYLTFCPADGFSLVVSAANDQEQLTLILDITTSSSSPPSGHPPPQSMWSRLVLPVAKGIGSGATILFLPTGRALFSFSNGTGSAIRQQGCSPSWDPSDMSVANTTALLVRPLPVNDTRRLSLRQMAYAALPRSAVFLASKATNTVLVAYLGDEDAVNVGAVLALIPFAGNGLPGPGDSQAMPRFGSVFHFPTGVAVACASGASPRERLRASCRPFALLVASVGSHVVQMVALDPSPDQESSAIRLVAGMVNQSGAPSTDEGRSGLSTMLAEPIALADMLDGTFAVVLRAANCIVILSSTNGTYRDVASFGDVAVRTFAGQCNISQDVSEPVPADGDAAYRRPVLRQPNAMVIIGQAAYIVQFSARVPVRVQPLYPASERRLFVIELSSDASMQAKDVVSHPLEPDTVLIISLSYFWVGLSSGSEWRVAGSSPGARAALFLPNGKLLVDYADVEDGAGNVAVLGQDCCFAAWTALPRGSATNSIQNARPAHLMPVLNVTQLSAGVSGIMQMVYVPTWNGRSSGALFMTDFSGHTVRVLEPMFSYIPRSVTVPGSVVFAGAHGESRETVPAGLKIGHGSPFLFSPLGLASVCANKHSPRKRRLLGCVPFGLLVSAFESHAVFFVSLDPRGSSWIVAGVAGRAYQTATNLTGQMRRNGVDDAYFNSPTYIADLWLDDGSVVVTSASSHCLIHIEAVNRSFWDSDSFGNVTVRSFAGRCGESHTDAPDGSWALDTAVFSLPVAVLAHQNGGAVYVGHSGSSPLLRVAPMFPAGSRRVWRVNAPPGAIEYPQMIWQHPMEPETLLVTQTYATTIVMLRVERDSTITYVGPWASLGNYGRGIVAIPDGRVVISRGYFSQEPLMFQECCVAGWRPATAASPSTTVSLTMVFASASRTSGAPSASASTLTVAPSGDESRSASRLLPDSDSHSAAPSWSAGFRSGSVSDAITRSLSKPNVTTTKGVTRFTTATTTTTPNTTTATTTTGTNTTTIVATPNASTPAATLDLLIATTAPSIPAVAVESAAVVVWATATITAPGSLSNAQRVASVLSVLQCETGVDVGPTAVQSPLPGLFGVPAREGNATGARGELSAAYLEAVLSNVIVVLPVGIAVIAAFHAVGFVVLGDDDVGDVPSGCTCGAVLGATRLSGSAFVPVMVVANRALEAATLAVSAVPSDGAALAAWCLTAVWNAAALLLLAYGMHRLRASGPDAWASVVEQPPSAKSSVPVPVQAFLAGGHRWSAAVGAGDAVDVRHRRLGLLYDAYWFERRWFLVVEMALATMATVFGSVRSESAAVCTAMMALVFAVSVAALVAMITLKPFLAPVDTWQSGVVGIATVVAAALAFHPATRGASEIVGSAAMFVAATRLFVDIAVFAMSRLSTAIRAARRTTRSRTTKHSSLSVPVLDPCEIEERVPAVTIVPTPSTLNGPVRPMQLVDDDDALESLLRVPGAAVVPGDPLPLLLTFATTSSTAATIVDAVRINPILSLPKEEAAGKSWSDDPAATVDDDDLAFLLS